MDVNEILNQLNLESKMVAIVIIVLAVVLVLFLNRKRLQVSIREWHIQRCLNQIGSEQVRDLICPDGLDGYYKIDRLALTQDAILLISYKPYVGNIYCADHISEWTQVIGQKSFKFENPLFELENQITSLKLLIGNAPVRGFLFFSHSAIFPKGHPDSILNPETIPGELLRANCGPANVEIQAAWELLKRHNNETAANGQVGVKT